MDVPINLAIRFQLNESHAICYFKMDLITNLKPHRTGITLKLIIMILFSSNSVFQTQLNGLISTSGSAEEFLDLK